MWVKHLFNSGYAFSFYLFISFSIFVQAASASQEIRCPLQSLYQFGDSISDTGNSIRILPIVASSRLPYGKTFPGNPTGRWSDGRLIIDYIATALGLPLLNPSLAKTASFNNGVNFAVAGSTALNTSFFLSKGVIVAPVPSLRVQLSQFMTYLNSICSTPSGFILNLHILDMLKTLYPRSS
ncbi:hypothetical protein Pfo_000369 [Paulownia fortunei]|nr:hypothetical protein Pfo_000369 [Paulownia fortunei]